LLAFLLLSVFFVFALSDVCAVDGVVGGAEAGDVCAAKAAAGIPMPPANDKVAKASAAYNGLRVNMCGR
jgi:hypothetical protein